MKFSNHLKSKLAARQYYRIFIDGIGGGKLAIGDSLLALGGWRGTIED